MNGNCIHIITTDYANSITPKRLELEFVDAY